MPTRVFGLAILALLCGCGDPDPAGDPASASEPFDGTVTFFIDPGTGKVDPGLAANTMVFLAVEKAGRTRLVDASQEAAPEGTSYGRHTFPEATTGASVASYYGGVLANAGWKTPTDFHVAGASIHFFGVDALRAGADRPDLQVGVTP